MKYLIVGLGNIGPEYANTRHNIGFMVVDFLAKKFEASFEIGRHAFYTKIKHKSRTLVLIKPTTYMNLSGKALQHWMSEEKISPENILIITDDLALPVGKRRIKGKGSDGGHNGLKSVQEVLGSNEYPRLRFGIGSDFAKGRQSDYVLGEFTEDEKITISIEIEKAADSVLAFSTIGLQKTMNQFN